LNLPEEDYSWWRLGQLLNMGEASTSRREGLQNCVSVDRDGLRRNQDLETHGGLAEAHLNDSGGAYRNQLRSGVNIAIRETGRQVEQKNEESINPLQISPVSQPLWLMARSTRLYSS
jgi:hypothetical protein